MRSVPCIFDTYIGMMYYAACFYVCYLCARRYSADYSVLIFCTAHLSISVCHVSKSTSGNVFEHC